MEVNSLEKLKQVGCVNKATGINPPTAADVDSDDDDETGNTICHLVACIMNYFI